MTLKQPAYAAELRQLLRNRVYPEYVVVYCGYYWHQRVQHVPCLCVPADFPVGVYDWSVLAGLRAHVVQRVANDREYKTPWPMPAHFPALVAEVAAFAAPVMAAVNAYGETIDEPGLERADSLLFGARFTPGLEHLWTPDAEADYLEREDAYYRAAAADRGVVVA